MLAMNYVANPAASLDWYNLTQIYSYTCNVAIPEWEIKTHASQEDEHIYISYQTQMMYKLQFTYTQNMESTDYL